MKNIYESSATFTAYATIQACHFELQQLFKRLNVSGLTALIDKATGYDKVLLRNTVYDVATLMTEIIKNKKILEMEYSSEKTILEKLNTFDIS